MTVQIQAKPQVNALALNFKDEVTDALAGFAARLYGAVDAVRVANCVATELSRLPAHDITKDAYERAKARAE